MKGFFSFSHAAALALGAILFADAFSRVALAQADELPVTSLQDAASGQTRRQDHEYLRPQVAASYHNDTSPPLRDMTPGPVVATGAPGYEPNETLKAPNAPIVGSDSVVESRPTSLLSLLAPDISLPLLNFDGIYSGSANCSGCSLPDPKGEVGRDHYVQVVNSAYRVFAKTNGTPLQGSPPALETIWAGFGGPCQFAPGGFPVVLYDQLAERWIITQVARTGSNPAMDTDQCFAVSATNDPLGSYHRYGFHLGSNEFFNPSLGLWPDAYYMSAIDGFPFFGSPQAFAFDRTKMLNGFPATFITFAPLGSTVPRILPADLDGSTLPPAGAPNPFVGFPDGGQYTTYHFHADFTTPGNSTFTTFATPAAASFAPLCPTTSSCVPQLGTTTKVNGLGYELMFRLAYRNFGTHESLIGNYSVLSGGVAGVHWFELRGVTTGPVTVFQEGTYQPDTTWRWNGSAAMDGQGNLVIGFSASSAAIHPQIHYAWRLANDPPNTLNQGETILFAGNGSRTGTFSSWGGSDLTVDPIDDSTFWYTNEYLAQDDPLSWSTRIGSFKLQAPPPCPDYSITQSTRSLVPASTDIGNHCDDCVTAITFPFPVSLYGTPYTTANASSNGNLQFAGGNNAAFNNTTLPAAGFNATIFPFWDDLRTDAAGNGIFTSVTGITPNRAFNIEWRVSRTASSATSNFEIRFLEGSPDFEVIYGASTGLLTGTIGVENSTNFFTQRAGPVAAVPPANTRLLFTTGCCLPIAFNGAIGSGSGTYPGSSGLQTGRLVPNGRRSACGTAKAFPGLTDTNSRTYDQYSFTNNGPAACVTFSVNTGCTALATQILPVAYLGSFNPANIAANYLGDPGASPLPFGDFSVNVPANATVVLVVSEVTAGGACPSYDVVVTGLSCPLALISAVSRKTHGAAGDFDIPLPLTGPPGVECRSSAGNHQFVLTFNSQVTSGNAAVTTGIGSAGPPTFAGNTMTVPLTGVSDIQQITVTLSGVTNSVGQVLPNTAVSMNVLLGDTTGNKTVNASDIGQTKAQSGLAVSAANFRTDTTASGSINASDISQVKANSGHTLP